MKRLVLAILCIMCASANDLEHLLSLFIITLAFTAYVHLSDYGWIKVTITKRRKNGKATNQRNSIKSIN